MTRYTALSARQKRDIMRIARAWALPDDWSVAALYMDTLANLLTAYALGIDVSDIVKHALHVSGCGCTAEKILR